ncbi:MAG: hypothetical protein AAF467_16985 [Actinomycetota bacterium]
MSRIRSRHRAARPIPVAIAVTVMMLSALGFGGSAADAGRLGALDAPSGTAVIDGMVTRGPDRGVAGLVIDVFSAGSAGGGRRQYLGSVETDGAGAYRVAVDPGCYVITIDAPPGERFVGSSSSVQHTVCVSSSESTPELTARLQPVAARASGVVAFADQLAFSDAGADDTLDPARSGEPTVGGSDGRVVIDLFRATAAGVRTGYVATTSTDANGSYTVALPEPGCYRLVFVAPRGTTFAANSPRYQTSVCLEPDEEARVVDVALFADGQGLIEGQVLHADAVGAPDVVVDVYAAAGDGSRSAFLGAVTTADTGLFRFRAGSGCYVLVLIAANGDRFSEGEMVTERSVCLSPDESVTGVDARLQGSSPAPAAFSAVEQELFRLTNALRANPSGPLRRQSPLPACVDDEFYEIEIDPSTAHPVPAPALAADIRTSEALATDWARTMHQTEVFEHRPSSAQEQGYAALGIAAAAWGENIAWASGYDRAEVARVHFEGWRESDTGHYCTLITPRFNNIGLGELAVEGESWAVQNFYEARGGP